MTISEDEIYSTQAGIMKFQIIRDLLVRGHTDLAKAIGAPSQKEPHPGAMVAFMAPQPIKDFFTPFLNFEGCTTPEDLHCTLIYLGDASDISETQASEIKQVCMETAFDYGPLDIKIGGFGRFLTDDDGQVLYASLDSVGLNELRADLSKSISPIVDFPKDHGFCPHMTLGFLKPGTAQEEPSCTKAEIPDWNADVVSLVMAGDQYHFELPGAGEAALSVESPRDQFQEDSPHVRPFQNSDDADIGDFMSFGRRKKK